MNTPFSLVGDYQRGKQKNPLRVNLKFSLLLVSPWRGGVDCGVKCDEWL